MMDSGCDVRFTKDRFWISKDDGKDFDMIRSSGVFFVAARLAKPTSREASTPGFNPVIAAEVEQAALAREHAAFGVAGPAAGRWKVTDPTVRIKVPKGLATPSGEERALHEASGHVLHCCWCQWSIAAALEETATDEAVSRIEFDFADLGQEEDQVLPIPSLNAVDVGSGTSQQYCVPRKSSVRTW